MGSMTASAGETVASEVPQIAAVFAAIGRLQHWLEVNDYKAYDVFDGLSSRIARPLTFETTLLRTVLLQGVRRFPLNLRPILAVPRARATKAFGFLARGYIRLHAATGDDKWAERAEFVLNWLIENQSPGYKGACWGNHFDYQSRTFYLPRKTPTVVWTALIGHAFFDAHRHFGKQRYLDVALAACSHIIEDLPRKSYGKDAVCISYIPAEMVEVHNANTLGASLLARGAAYDSQAPYRDVAEKALRYTADRQLANGAWYYGEKENLHWVDNFHTAYVLDCFKYFRDSSGDRQFDPVMLRGYEYWKRTFFQSDGLPRYYDKKTLPIDIQCSSQAIDTFLFFRDLDPDSLAQAMKVANWTIANMQDESGFFYYRAYGAWLKNRTPTLHWGQATMMCALSALYQGASSREFA
jgi:hypothetical protein